MSPLDRQLARDAAVAVAVIAFILGALISLVSALDAPSSLEPSEQARDQEGGER